MKARADTLFPYVYMEKEYSKYDIIELLVGPVTPVADSREDRDRLENLIKLGQIFTKTYQVISGITKDYQDLRGYESAGAIIEEAEKIFEEVGITDNRLNGEYEEDMLLRISVATYPDRPDLAKAYREGFKERCQEEIDANS